MSNILAVLKRKQDFKIDEKMALDFRLRCRVLNADGFLKFLQTTSQQQTVSYLELVNEVSKNLHFEDVPDMRKTPKNKKELKTTVINFFNEYMPKKADEVKQVFGGTHPAFTTPSGKNRVFIKKVFWGTKSSGVNHIPGNEFLNMMLCLNGNLEDYIAAAHEMSHALSASMQNSLISNQFYKDIDDKNEDYFKQDCICEIESHITEKLFCEYMYKKGKFNAEDCKNFNDKACEEQYFHSKLISEEEKIVSQIKYPITAKTLNELYNSLQQQKNYHIVSRFKKMCYGYSDYNSCYVFRYFVAEVVADQWFKKYQSSNDNEKQNMLNNFQDYLDKTTDLELDSACQMLLGQNFDKIAINYVNDLKRKNIKAKAKQIVEQAEDTLEDGEDVFAIWRIIGE